MTTDSIISRIALTFFVMIAIGGLLYSNYVQYESNEKLTSELYKVKSQKDTLQQIITFKESLEDSLRLVRKRDSLEIAMLYQYNQVTTKTIGEANDKQREQLRQDYVRGLDALKLQTEVVNAEGEVVRTIIDRGLTDIKQGIKESGKFRMLYWVDRFLRATVAVQSDTIHHFTYKYWPRLDTATQLVPVGSTFKAVLTLSPKNPHSSLDSTVNTFEAIPYVMDKKDEKFLKKVRVRIVGYNKKG